jgi:hypothetical protein
MAEDDFKWNKHVEVKPPEIPKTSSKGLIVGVIIVVLGIGAAAYGYHAGIFKASKADSEAYTFKGDC